MSCPDGYGSRLADRQRRLADLVPPGDALPDGSRATVAVTWSLSVDVADAHPPAGLARQVLSLTAVLDPNGIPASVLTTDAAVAHFSQLSGQRVGVDDVRDALRNLHRLNLVTDDPETGMVRVHAMVQRATSDSLDSVELATVARVAADILLSVWPAIDRDHGIVMPLQANTTALQATTGETLLNPDTHRLLYRGIHSLGETGQVAEAAARLVRLLADQLPVLGPDHPDVLTTRHDLAHWRGEAGDPAGAAAAYEKVLVARSRVLWPDDPDTLTTRGNLARWRGLAGDPVGAVDAYERLLPDRLRVLSPDHPDTLTTRHHLAHWRQQQAAAPQSLLVKGVSGLVDLLGIDQGTAGHAGVKRIAGSW